MENNSFRTFTSQDGSIATPSYELVKILIMEKQENASLTLAWYEKQKALGLDGDLELGWVVSRNKILFLALEPWIREANKDSPDLADNLWKDLDIKEEEVQVRLYRFMTAFLYENGLTKINLRKVRAGPPIAEEQNMEDGY